VNLTADNLIKKYARKAKEGSPIVFFLSWENGEIKYQGYIFGLNKDGGGIAQLFEWFTGGESDTLMFTRVFLDHCTFYATDIDMRMATERAELAEVT